MKNKLIEFIVNLLKVPNSVKKEVKKTAKKPKPKPKTKSTSTKLLGHISKKFESGRSGPGTVSSGRGDPGGVSYGCHQLASFAKQGRRAKDGSAILSYMKRCVFAPEFKGLVPNSPAFTKKWKEIAKKHPRQFTEDQHKFIKKSHFDSLRGYATGLNIPSTPAINEALFSIGVQHGRSKKVVRNANISPSDSESTIVNKLYDSRTAYVKGIRLNRNTRQSVLNRYKAERKLVLALCK